MAGSREWEPVSVAQHFIFMLRQQQVQARAVDAAQVNEDPAANTCAHISRNPIKMEKAVLTAVILIRRGRPRNQILSLVPF